MKKSVVLLVSAVLIISLISISFVSASWLGDLWNKIIGKAEMSSSFCAEGGYMDALDCRYDPYSCPYNPKCSQIQTETETGCRSKGCAAANYDVISCKTMCSIINGQSTCYECSWDAGTGMCTQTQQCEPVGDIFCLPGMRKCTDKAIREVCSGGSWVIEENCSETKHAGICALSSDMFPTKPTTGCIECDADGDGFVPANAMQFGCYDCAAGAICDCNDNPSYGPTGCPTNPDDCNSLPEGSPLTACAICMHPGKEIYCTDGIDNDCDNLIDSADPDCAVPPVPPVPQACTDSDGGYNIYQKGTINDVNGYTNTDSCTTTGQLTEYDCGLNGVYIATTLSCPPDYKCQDGACNLSCVKEGEYLIGFHIPEYDCCPGLKRLVVIIGQQAGGGPLGAVIGTEITLSFSDIWDRIVEFFIGKKVQLSPVSETSAILCYNESEGIPVCKYIGTSLEGWYYNNTGRLLRYEKCGVELTCTDLCGVEITCSDCAYNRGTAGAAAAPAALTLSLAENYDLTKKISIMKSAQAVLYVEGTGLYSIQDNTQVGSVQISDDRKSAVILVTDAQIKTIDTLFGQSGYGDLLSEAILKVGSRAITPAAPVSRTISDEGLNLIRRFECFKSKVYICPAGKSTIGYGHVVKANEKFGEITLEEGEKLLRQDVKIAENAVASYVKVSLTQGQYDALVSFTFNVGDGNLRRSALLRYLNEGKYEKAANEFPKWNKGSYRDKTGKKVLKVLNGLTIRRAAEMKMFLGTK